MLRPTRGIIDKPSQRKAGKPGIRKTERLETRQSEVGKLRAILSKVKARNKKNQKNNQG